MDDAHRFERFIELIESYAPPGYVIDELAALANVNQERRVGFTKNIKLLTLAAWHMDEPGALDKVGCELADALGIANALANMMVQLSPESSDFLSTFAMSSVKSDIALVERKLAEAAWLAGFKKRGRGRPSRTDASPQNLILCMAYGAAVSVGGSLGVNKNAGDSENYGLTQPDSVPTDPYRGTFSEYWRLLTPYLPCWLQKTPSLGTLYGIARDAERKPSLAG